MAHTYSLVNFKRKNILRFGLFCISRLRDTVLISAISRTAGTDFCSYQLTGFAQVLENWNLATKIWATMKQIIN